MICSSSAMSTVTWSFHERNTWVFSMYRWQLHTDGRGRGSGRPTSNKMQETKEMKENEKEELDSGSALQLYLDRIPINSIPGIANSDVLELKTGDTVKDAIQLLYEKDVLGAPIVDVVSPDTRIGRSSDNYIGFIDLAGMVLWSLKQFEKAADNVQTKGCDSKSGIFAMLEENPQIGQTKIGELAKAYLWDPFFPVNLDSTLFHVLLLLSKHQIKVVPVVEQSNSRVIGFVTQNAVIHLLLQSNGLEWFDSIADKALSEFRFVTEKQLTHAYGDQSLAEALHLLLKSQIGFIPVLNRATKRLIGSIRSCDIYLLLENDNIFDNRKSITAEEFIRMETDKSKSDSNIEPDVGALLLAGILRLRNNFLPEMNSPVTSKRSDTLKHLMTKMADKKSSFSFIVDDLQQVTGVVSSRDVIVEFAPPCIDSSIHGGGFFDCALEQTGCHVQNGTLISDR